MNLSFDARVPTEEADNIRRILRQPKYSNLIWRLTRESYDAFSMHFIKGRFSNNLVECLVNYENQTRSFTGLLGCDDLERRLHCELLNLTIEVEGNKVNPLSFTFNGKKSKQKRKLTFKDFQDGKEEETKEEKEEKDIEHIPF